MARLDKSQKLGDEDFGKVNSPVANPLKQHDATLDDLLGVSQHAVATVLCAEVEMQKNQILAGPT